MLTGKFTGLKVRRRKPKIRAEIHEIKNRKKYRKLIKYKASILKLINL